MRTLLILATALCCTACCPRNYYSMPFYSYSNEPISLGNVQRKLQRGMTPDQVAYALGSPNIVTKDKHGRETWIYDLMSSETEISRSGSEGWLILFANRRAKVSTESRQKTLTVIVKFDDYGGLYHVSYHSSKF